MDSCTVNDWVCISILPLVWCCMCKTKWGEAWLDLLWGLYYKNIKITISNWHLWLRSPWNAVSACSTRGCQLFPPHLIKFTINVCSFCQCYTSTLRKTFAIGVQLLGGAEIPLFTTAAYCWAWLGNIWGQSFGALPVGDLRLLPTGCSMQLVADDYVVGCCTFCRRTGNVRLKISRSCICYGQN
jgi:hypothetical protein